MLHVVVADKKHLCILRVDPDGALIVVHASEDPNAVEHERDLRADRPGRVFNAAARTRVSLAQKSSARALAVQRWLKSIGLTLRSMLANGHSDGIILVASARLLGPLRVAIPLEVRRKVLVEVARDLGKHSPASLWKHLQPALREAQARLRRRTARSGTEPSTAGQ